MQTTSSILMIRPVNFGFNEQTAESNAFQVKADGNNIHEQALKEFDGMVEVLRENGVDVTVIDDTIYPATPDSIFPNNWVSFHHTGAAFIYPMQAANRREERRTDIMETIKHRFKLLAIQDLSYFENNGRFLEGTGSMVLDRDNKIAYACLSPRTDAAVIHKFCELSGYTSCCFHAKDQNGKAIYHTNVMMCVGERFSVICLDSITDASEQQAVIHSLEKTGKKLIAISFDQMNQFAGNMLQVKNQKGENLLVMSQRAYQSLTADQVAALSAYARMVYAPLQTIENCGGGSARCMIAEIHLPRLVD